MSLLDAIGNRCIEMGQTVYIVAAIFTIVAGISVVVKAIRIIVKNNKTELYYISVCEGVS